MRVLHISSGNMFGGVETMLLTLARCRHLCPEMEPGFALCFEGRLSDELQAAKVAVHPLGPVRSSRPLTIWRARRNLTELLAKEKFDAAICHMPWSLAVLGPAVRRAGIPLFFWSHFSPNGRNWLELWAKRSRPVAVLSNSQHTAEQTSSRLFPGIPSEVVYCPIASGEREEQSRTQTRAELGVSDEVVIIQVSRMEPWKGHRLHFRALSQIRELSGWVCWVVGGAQRPEEVRYVAQLEKAAAELGIADRVRFLGQRSDVPRLLAAADIHCQPNQGPEPFGITFVEALLAGLPVVTTDLGGAREIVDSRCGLLVAPENATALAEALRLLILSPQRRSALGRNGPARARELCDPASQLRTLQGLLQRYASGQERAADELPLSSMAG